MPDEKDHIDILFDAIKNEEDSTRRWNVLLAQEDRKKLIKIVQTLMGEKENTLSVKLPKSS
jgi:hypothetical protein